MPQWRSGAEGRGVENLPAWLMLESLREDADEQVRTVAQEMLAESL
jgi:hypothetical protein